MLQLLLHLKKHLLGFRGYSVATLAPFEETSVDQVLCLSLQDVWLGS